VRDRLEQQTLSDPRLRRHLESLATFDVERFAVEQDVRAMRDFSLSDVQPICREVARAQGDVLRAHLQTGSAAVGEHSASEWETHVEECVYCRGMRRLVQARLTAEELGLPEGELLLRDRLLEPLYGDELDRLSWKILIGPRRIEDPSEQTDVMGTRTRLDSDAFVETAVEAPEEPAGSLVEALGAALRVKDNPEEFDTRIADLYRVLHPFVARRVKVWNLPADVADDLTAETLQRLLERLRTSEQSPKAAELLAWLKVLIRNRTLEYHRSGGRREERIALLQSALEELKPRLSETEWQMLVDRFLHAQSLPEIAAAHGLPLGSVVITMQRILRRVMKEVRVKRD
jgi:DNA-directed RNA polymerase specialized sigma24 family protein